MSQLHTIGYEGAHLDDFIATLKNAEVEVLIDIRDFPGSRKKGFSKTALALALSEVGVNYIHLRDLGDPKPGREAARRGDYRAFERIFRNHLAREESQEALVEAVNIAKEFRSSLLCYERDHSGCHRSIVAEAMASHVPFRIEHLGVRTELAVAG
ncbi:MAG: DUF488 family protein [Alphaproteobacteria bacterium]|nr:DUF488 family protein [Alphaproteobacteria bacterium]